MKVIIALLVLAFAVMACQALAPLPDITAEAGSEFTLGIGQSAAIEDAGLTITLKDVTGDDRCPYELECAMSGPVSLTITVQKDSETPVDFDLQSFTDYEGRSPEGHFEGIESQVEYEGYVIEVKGILPFPQRSHNEIQDSQYRVTLIVNKK